MNKQKLKTYAAVTATDDEIVNNSMKLYSYLLCIAGKEKYGSGRLFQHKNLNLTEIKKCTGLDPKTTKRYLYELEYNNLISFRGKERFDYIPQNDYQKVLANGSVKLDRSAYRAAKEKEAFRVWKLRDKNDYYLIPRAEPYTPIPEITLEKLNKVFGLSEMEMKFYFICCTYRDLQVDKNEGKPFIIKFEDIKDLLKIKDTGNTYNRKIKSILYFLKGIGLINFENTYYYNSHNVKIECFKLTEVYYYVTYNEVEVSENDVDKEIVNEVKNRL